MKPLALRFLLEYGAFLDVIMPREEALALVKAWQERKWQLANKLVVGGTDLRGVVWALEVSRIMGVHTAEVQQPANPHTPQLYPTPRGSG